MKLLRKISNFFERIEHDVRLFSVKPSLIFGAITLVLGILCWIIGGRTDRVYLLFQFPRSAISIGFMYFLWGISFAFIGIMLGGIFFGCEKYKRREAIKTAIFVILSLLFTLCIYPVFFRCAAPFFAFPFILVSALFCFLAIVSALRIYSLWSLCLMIHLIWLVYNCYVTFAIALIN